MYNSLRKYRHFHQHSVRCTLICVFFVLFCFSPSLWGQIYKCENDLGEINFSDEPCAEDEETTKIKWLKLNSNSPDNTSSVSTHMTQPKAQSKFHVKAKDNSPHAMLLLLTTTRLKLDTKSIHSRLDDQLSEPMELLLPDGITVDLLKIKSIEIDHTLDKDKIGARLIMDNGYEETKILEEPYPELIGETKIGRFNKSFADIRRIDFFNNKKLLKKRNKKAQSIANKRRILKKKIKKPLKNPAPKQEVPVIELDLSANLSTEQREKNLVKALTNIGKPSEKTNTELQNNSQLIQPFIPPETKPEAKPQAEPEIKLAVKDVPKTAEKIIEKSTDKVAEQIKTVQKAKTEKAQEPQESLNNVLVNMVDERKVSLLKTTISSSRGDSKPHKQFMFTKKEQIPFKEIKSIKVRSTSDKGVLVAVALRTGEIKMAKMDPPFTQIHGNTGQKAMVLSLDLIRSMSFQR